jgi:hypothetical protein
MKSDSEEQSEELKNSEKSKFDQANGRFAAYGGDARYAGYLYAPYAYGGNGYGPGYRGYGYGYGY